MAKEGSNPQNSKVAGIEWTVYPFKRNRRLSTALILFLVVLCAGVYFSFDNSLTFLLLSAVILISSLSTFFLPTTYILQDDRIIIKSLLRKYSREWGYFKSYYPDKRGALLSPFALPSRLENFRGVYIRFDENRAEVLDFIGKKMGKGEREKAGKGESGKGRKWERERVREGESGKGRKWESDEER